MRGMTILGILLATVTWAGAQTLDQTEAWRPMHAFIGTWKGVRASGKVTRTYASAPTNHHLEITEKAGGPAGVWGIVSYDTAKSQLVLRQFGTDGSATEVALDPAASNADQLVFAGGETRITYRREGWNAFTERVERGAALVSETRFQRKD